MSGRRVDDPNGAVGGWFPGIPLFVTGAHDASMGAVADPITVFLLDDHEIVRRGVADLLDAEDDIRVIGEAATQEQAVGRVHALDPDVAILDVRLAGRQRHRSVPRDPLAAPPNRLSHPHVVRR